VLHLPGAGKPPVGNSARGKRRMDTTG